MAINVLIVEDEAVIAESLQALLQVKGYEVACAGDGSKGIASARKSHPNLILLDVMLPKINGLEVCRILKADPATKNIRIVMVTGLGRSGDVDAAFAAGADDYIFKPFDAERLCRKIEKVLAAPGPSPA